MRGRSRVGTGRAEQGGGGALGIRIIRVEEVLVILASV